MDNRITIGIKLDIEMIETRLSVDEDKSPTVYTSQILDELENGDLLISMPFHEGKLVPLPIGKRCNTTFYAKGLLLRCQAETVARYKKGEIFILQITQKTILEKVQRREYFRFNCHIPIEYHVLTNNEIKNLENNTNNDSIIIDHHDGLTWNKGIMLDLSGGGMRFVSPVREEKDALILVSFDMECGDQVEKINVFAYILRSQQNINNHNLYDIHAKFAYMNDSIREKIIRYTFEQQRKMRAKQMGM